MDSAGNLYGTTPTGGAANHGTVFKLDPTGHETVLYSFTGINGDGLFPLGSLIMDSAGNLYGTTAGGGITSTAIGSDSCEADGGGCGTVFVLTP
jgi:uncharacterized repeat protein (TIGR03803 family)